VSKGGIFKLHSGYGLVGWVVVVASLLQPRQHHVRWGNHAIALPWACQRSLPGHVIPPSS